MMLSAPVERRYDTCHSRWRAAGRAHVRSVSSICTPPHRQSSRTTCSRRGHPALLTLAIRQTERSHRPRPTSPSHTPWLNPHSACGTAAAPPTAISCLGAFWTPAVSAG